MSTVVHWMSLISLVSHPAAVQHACVKRVGSFILKDSPYGMFCGIV